MKLKPVSIKELIDVINKSKISTKKKRYFIKQLYVQLHIYSYATDGKYTVITDGERVGIAKRTTYLPRRDGYDFAMGMTIALFRMLKNKKEI